jgi:LysR family transcriptional regulator, glycine cleavage system transcriptional activator
MTTKPPLHALQAFVAVAREKNLTRAAAQMNLTVSALSHQMRTLEERFKQTLLSRGPRGVTLTAAGQRLLDGIATPLEAIERVFAAPYARSEHALTLSAVPSFASSWLLPRIPAFMAQHPGLEFNLQTTTALVDFEREIVDAALRLGSGQWAGLRAEHLFDEWVAPVASPKLIAKLGKPKLADLGRLPLLGEPSDNDRWTKWFSRFGGTRPKRFVASFSDAEMLHKAAAEGAGVAMGRLILAQPLLANGSLVLLTRERMPAEYGHYLVYPARNAEHPPMLAFRAWLLGEVRAYLGEAALGRKSRDQFRRDEQPLAAEGVVRAPTRSERR